MDVFRDDEYMFTLATLEQELNQNESNNSCIPPGFYFVEHYSGQKNKNVFHILGTDPRSYILIHAGNFNTSTTGCVVVGLTHADINSDGYQDTVSSNDALNKLRDICQNQKAISIEIKS